MPFKFPYTNFQELNLDWIIKKVKDLSKQIEDDSSIVSEYIDRLIAVEDKADNAEATATAADARATGANNTANSALTLATQAKQTAEIADLSTTLLGLKIGDLSSLYTTAKDTIVNAINEVWSIFHNATAVTNVTPAGTDPAVTYSNGVFTFDLPEGGDPDAVTHAELDAAIDDVEDTIDALTDRVDGLEDSIDELSEDKADAIIDTASGDVASFPDGTATPLKSLVVNVEPVQAGTGDPSPNNIRPISGWTGCEVYDTGHNVWNETWEIGDINPDTGQNQDSSQRLRSKGYISVKPNTQYFICVDVPQSISWVRICYYNAEKNFVSIYSTNKNNAFTTPNNASYMRFSTPDGWHGETYTGGISINYPSTDTEYHAYHGNSYPVTFGETVYGGSAEVVEGKRIVDRSVYTITGQEIFGSFLVDTNTTRVYLTSERIPSSMKPNNTSVCMIMCDKLPTFEPDYIYRNDVQGISENRNLTSNGLWIRINNSSLAETTLSGIQAYFSENPITVCYYIATPIETDITPTPVTALSGYNAVWADAGSVDVTYRADTKGYIDKLIAQVQALALGG